MILAALALLACKRITDISMEKDVHDAELIVRVTAVDYDQPPRDSNEYTLGTIHFRVDELIKGRHAPTDLTLPGKFDPGDDFNDRPAPYNFVRSTGRWGSCYTDRYRRGASYLLLLKTRESAWTTHWDALAPLNEQLHGKDDPWVVWVRKQAAQS